MDVVIVSACFLDIADTGKVPICLLLYPQEKAPKY